MAFKKRPISEAFACHNPSSGTGSFRSKNYERKWNEDAIVTYLNSHPQRANLPVCSEMEVFIQG